ncbi:MAG: hypothetical protein UHD09_02390 [Bifidobacterium sp.]|nr:hypothetical protein [Bifidobacterium sp.]
MLALWTQHYWALQYDWQHAWGHLLDLTCTPLWVAWAQLKEILRDHATSHSYAALVSMSYLPGDAEVILYALGQSGSKIRKTPDWLKPDALTDRPAPIVPTASAPDMRLRHELNERLGIT